MMISRRFKIGCLMTLLVGFCLSIGFVFGILAHQAWKKKTVEPAFMKWVAMKQLKKLELSPEQQSKVEKRVDAAVSELLTFRTDAMKQICPSSNAPMRSSTRTSVPPSRRNGARSGPNVLQKSRETLKLSACLQSGLRTFKKQARVTTGLQD